LLCFSGNVPADEIIFQWVAKASLKMVWRFAGGLLEIS
jgi:hypothetical protein